MNATPSINLNAANTVQPAPSGKSQNASTESSFKQVLSSETSRRSEHTARDQKEARLDAAESKSASTQAMDPEAATSDTSTDISASTTDSLLAMVVLPETHQAQPADSIGLALTPQLLPPAEGTGDEATGDPALAHSLKLDTENGRKGRTIEPQAHDAGQMSDSESATVPGEKTRLQAAIQAATAQLASSSPAATTASAFAGQLAAARQAEALNAKELPIELLGATPLRGASAQTELPMPSVDPLASSKLTPSVGTTAWSQALGEKVVWMAAGAQQTASLTLNPPNMGPLQIVLNLSNDQASASFFSAQPEVRQALEAAFPKLREMMNEAGIQLGQASVSAESPRQNDTGDRQAQRAAMPFNVSDDGVSMGQGLPHSVTPHSGRGLIDTFA